MKKGKDPLKNLDGLLKKAKANVKEESLKNRLSKNLNLFKSYGSSLYDEYINYTPEIFDIAYDKDNHLNLINKHTFEPVYRSEPKAFCQKQVADYIKAPHHLKAGHVIGKENPICHFFQYDYLEKIKRQYIDDYNGFNGDIHAPIGLMLVNNCGLGYHLIELVEQLNINNLLIFEEFRDSFYASLHTVDWQIILDYFDKKGRSLHLFIGLDDTTNLMNLAHVIKTAGFHNAVNAFHYKHFKSPRSDAFFIRLHNEYHFAINGFGFLEDEQIGIAHTAINLNNGLHLLNNNQPQKEMPPIFITGNGPSLDDLFDVIKSYQDKAIIMSCGSSIGTLIKAGIIPDIHIETERTYMTTKMLEEFNVPDILKTIDLITLNTMAPEVLPMFNQAYICIKADDAAALIIDDDIGERYQPLSFPNPTCVNMGLSVALRLGFRQLFFAGVDLGMKDERIHHAKSSQYFDNSNSMLFLADEDEPITLAKGNFSENIFTTPTHEKTKNVLSITLSHYPNAKAYNLNDGIFIEGSIPLEKDKLLPVFSELNKLDKQSFKATLFSHHFNYHIKEDKLSKETIKDKYTKPALNFLQAPKFNTLPKNIFDVHLQIEALLADIAAIKKDSMLSFYLISGIMQQFINLMMYSVITSKNHRDLINRYQFVADVINGYCEEAYHLIANDLLKTSKSYKPKTSMSAKETEDDI